MMWKIYNHTNQDVYEFKNSQVISFGNHNQCEIKVGTTNAIHSQMILDTGFIFYILNNQVKIYFCRAEIKIEKTTITIEYDHNFSFNDYWYEIENQHKLFASEEFTKLLTQVQKTFFEFYQFNIEMRAISVTDMVQHGSGILAKQILDQHSVFEPEKRTKFKQLIWCLWAQIFEYGLLTPAILNPEISEIMVNGYNKIYFEVSGKIISSQLCFTNENELLSLIERICSSVGRRIDSTIPYCDARLKEGHRVHAIIPPLSLVGPCLTIRKFPNFSYNIDMLVAQNSVSFEMAEFLKTAILEKKNIIISGGTGSGKTTLLNCLSSFIPVNERVLTIEDSAELKLQKPHVIRLECRNENIENQGKVTIRDLVRNALRMRPDRIIVGECRGAEALDMLQAMNTGHDGSMTTLHANSPQDALRRLETLILFSEVDLPSRVIREQLATAIHFIVQQSRLSCGKRCVTKIEKVIGFDQKSSLIQTENLYSYCV